jgi:hypothetical protein
MPANANDSVAGDLPLAQPLRDRRPTHAGNRGKFCLADKFNHREPEFT